MKAESVLCQYFSVVFGQNKPLIFDRPMDIKVSSGGIFPNFPNLKSSSDSEEVIKTALMRNTIKEFQFYLEGPRPFFLIRSVSKWIKTQISKIGVELDLGPESQFWLLLIAIDPDSIEKDADDLLLSYATEWGVVDAKMGAEEAGYYIDFFFSAALWPEKKPKINEAVTLIGEFPSFEVDEIEESSSVFSSTVSFTSADESTQIIDPLYIPDMEPPIPTSSEEFEVMEVSLSDEDIDSEPIPEDIKDIKLSRVTKLKYDDEITQILAMSPFRKPPQLLSPMIESQSFLDGKEPWKRQSGRVGRLATSRKPEGQLNQGSISIKFTSIVFGQNRPIRFKRTTELKISPSGIFPTVPNQKAGPEESEEVRIDIMKYHIKGIKYYLLGDKPFLLLNSEEKWIRKQISKFGGNEVGPTRVSTDPEAFYWVIMFALDWESIGGNSEDFSERIKSFLQAWDLEDGQVTNRMGPREATKYINYFEDAKIWSTP